MSSKDCSIAQILSALENRATEGNDRLECYTSITKKFKEDGGRACGAEVMENMGRVLTVIQVDIAAAASSVAQAALEVLGNSLHDAEIVQSVSPEEGRAVIQALCGCMTQTDDKITCTRALWCVGKQNLPDALLQKHVNEVLTAVEEALDKWKGQALTVEHESVNTIARLTEQAPGEMSGQGARWGPILLGLVSHAALRVRDHVLAVIETALPLMEAQRKDLAAAVMPTFKTKVVPELKKLFSCKQELYVLQCWGVLVQLFAEELHHGSFINLLLPVVELGFKSVSPEVKVESFRAWQHLIDNFALNPSILGDPKRIKLVMQVFRLNNAKTEAVAQAKLRVWWHFIWMLGSKLSSNFDMVAVPFLQFCVGGSKLTEHQMGGTPRAGLKVGASPATPRMNLSVVGGAAGSQWPVFKSLHASGCEALALMLGLPDLAEFDHHFKLDALRFEVVTGPSFFIKQSSVLITTATELFTSLGQDVSESLVLHIWHWLIAHLNNAVDSPLKLDIRDTLNTLLTRFQLLILTRVLPSPLVLGMFEGLCQLPRKVLCSTAYSIRGDKTVNGTPALFLMELLLTPTLLTSSCTSDTYHHLFSRLVGGGLGGSTCSLGFLQAVLETLARHVAFVEDREQLWRLWSATVNPLLENISKTSEVNQGDALEPNFDSTVQALTLPAVGKLYDMPSPSIKTMLKTWTDLFKTVDRLAAMVTNAEANVICETVCQKLLECSKTEEPMTGAQVDLLAQFCQVMASGLDFSSLDTQSAFNLGKTPTHSYSPKKVTKKRHKPLENIHSLVCLLAQLQETALHLASDTHMAKKPSSVPVQSIFNTLVDVFSLLFSHVSSSYVISNMIGVLAGSLGSLYTEAGKRSVKVYNNAFQQKLEKLWMDICTCLQSRYTSLYDSEFLQRLSPLLEATFLHSRRQIKNQTVALWSSTFSKVAALDYPDNLRAVLTKVKEKSTIQLPGWVAMASPVIEETPISQMSQSQAPEPKLPGMPSPHKIHGSFLNKAVSPSMKKSPLRPPLSPNPVAKGNSAKKKVLGWDGDDQDFVVIKSSPRKKMALTEHQREVRKEKRVFPAMYNSLEISQDVSMMASHLGADTQTSETNTPTPTFTQPFSLFGSMVPPTAEQKPQTDSQKSTQPCNDVEKKAMPEDRKRKEVFSSPEENSTNKSKCRRSVRFKDKAESSQDSAPTKKSCDTESLADAIVIEDKSDGTDTTAAATYDKVDTVDLTKDSQEVSSKDSSDKDSSVTTSIPQNVLGAVGFSQLSATKSSQSKSSKTSEESNSPATETAKTETDGEIPAKRTDIFKSFGKNDDDMSDEEACLTSSEPLLRWTQKLNELNQSPGLKSPVRKALSQDSRSPKRTGSPHRSPKKSKKKLTNENSGFGALDKWVIRSPGKNLDFVQKLSQDIVVASVTSVNGTFVEETQSPTKFKDTNKPPVDKMASIMETPPKNVLEDLSVSHGNSSRKLFNSQNSLAEADMMEDSNIVPASPNSKSYSLRTGTPVLKVKRLTEEEIRRYSPSRGTEPEEPGSPSNRTEKHKKVKCNLNSPEMQDKIVSHVHDDFSEFTPLVSEGISQIEPSLKTITDSEQVMVTHLEKIEGKETGGVVDKETQELFSQDIQADNVTEKEGLKESDIETASQDSQEDSFTEETTKEKPTRKSRSRKQETPKKKSPEEKTGKKKKADMVATKVSKRIQKRREKGAAAESLDKNKTEIKDTSETQDIFDSSPSFKKNLDNSDKSQEIVDDKSGMNDMEDMEIDLTPVGMALDGTQLMETDIQLSTSVLIGESKAVEDGSNSIKDSQSKEKPEKKNQAKLKAKTQKKGKKSSEESQDIHKDKDETETELKVVCENTPEAKISPNQPGRRSTTKRKKAVAQKMTLKRSKDIIVNDGDSNLDIDMSDEDIPKIDLKKIVGENLEKKLDDSIESNHSIVNGDVNDSGKTNFIINDKHNEVKESKSEDGQKKSDNDSDVAKLDQNDSFVSDDDVPLVAIKEKIEKKEKKKQKKMSGVAESGSPVASKLRSSNVKVTRLRSAEKKVRTSPQSKKSVKLAAKRARSVEAKNRTNDKNALYSTETEADMKSTQTEHDDKTEQVNKHGGTTILKDTGIEEKDSENLEQDATQPNIQNNSVIVNGESGIAKGKLAIDVSENAQLDETPKKGIQASVKNSLSFFDVNSDSKLVLGSRKFERKSGFARRSILKSSGLTTSEGGQSPKRREFHPITVARIYSPTASPSASILKKRRLTDDSGSDTNSPPAKQRRVSFAEPLEAERQAQEALPSSPLTKTATDKCLPATPSSSCGRTDSQSTAGASQASFHSTAESELDGTEPVYPGLQTCGQDVDKVLPQLTSSIWSRGLGQLMRARNIQTIGDLSGLTETDIQSLPIKSPKVQTVRKVLDKFSQTQRARAVKLWGPARNGADTAGNKPKEGDSEVRVIEPAKTVTETVIQPETAAKEMPDKEVSQSDIEAIMASSGDLLTQVNKLSQTIGQSQSQDLSCDTFPSQSASADSAQTSSGLSSSQGTTGTQFLETLRTMNGNESDILKSLRVDELFQVHQLITGIQNQVVNTLKTRCHSPSNTKH